ncbi:MAG: hypothetical protein ACRDN0_21940 [Trebonia sp.]
MFTDHRNRAAMRDWEPAARPLLSQFRAAVGRRPDAQRLITAVNALSAASLEFRTRWEEYPVSHSAPQPSGCHMPPQAGGRRVMP